MSLTKNYQNVLLLRTCPWFCYQPSSNVNLAAIKGDDFPISQPWFQASGEQGSVVIKFTQIVGYNGDWYAKILGYIMIYQPTIGYVGWRWAKHPKWQLLKNNDDLLWFIDGFLGTLFSDTHVKHNAIKPYVHWVKLGAWGRPAIHELHGASVESWKNFHV